MSMSLAHLTSGKEARTARFSSWDQRGRNQDYWTTPAHSTRVLADLEVLGRIPRIWMPQFCRRTLGPAERTRQRGERSPQESEANIKQAATVRRRYDERTDR